MESRPQFRTDLYKGTASYYDRYRVPYPAPTILSALGNQVEAFECDLRDRLLAIQPDGNFEESVSFTYDLAVKL